MNFALGANHVVAINKKQELWGWGYNDCQQLGIPKEDKDKDAPKEDNA